ncbi:MAG: copper homeostasis protein CutC [Endozoicomonas sp. (ex Botrylloides leachii)]|nr:copper homeostasis protein CutC [Endozoicomonas sp. (ex Botrylloides leachii)]
MIDLEVCVHSISEPMVFTSVCAARLGGAKRIELCANMSEDGLTPPAAHIESAKEAFDSFNGLLVMIRPTAYDFYYDNQIIKQMEQQILTAANAGADGVVFGVLDPITGGIHKEKCRRLIAIAKERGLSTTFHRAFDAVPNWQQALNDVVALGIDRVLSSGTPWGTKQTALHGLKQLSQMLQHLQGHLELVVGGGVSIENVAEISEYLSRVNPCFSLHAYSAVLESALVSKEKVSQLIGWQTCTPQRSSLD